MSVDLFKNVSFIRNRSHFQQVLHFSNRRSWPRLLFVWRSEVTGKDGGFGANLWCKDVDSVGLHVAYVLLCFKYSGHRP